MTDIEPQRTLTERRVETIARADDAAVDAFASAMKAKLAVARSKGRGGWQEALPEALSRMLHEHVAKGDPVDVANFCMFLSLRGLRIIAADPATPMLADVLEVLECVEWHTQDAQLEAEARALIQRLRGGS